MQEMALAVLLLIAALEAGQAAQPKPPPGSAPLQPAPGNPVVVISTSMGDISVELFRDKAPVSVANFLQYVADGFFTGTILHRIERHFVIQGGGFTADLVEKPTRPPIQNEATNGLRNRRGTVAMARRPALRSATSQFYFNLSDNVQLDHRGFTPSEFGYAVFGQVIGGMDVVDRIGAVPTRSTGEFDGLPVEPVVIKGVRVIASLNAPKLP